MSVVLKKVTPAKVQAGFVSSLDLRKPWIERFMIHNGHVIPVVYKRLSRTDRWDSVKARWGIGRMHYSVPPGLYATGTPTAESPVFVTANYKMSFDALRASLGSLDGWILVLDTKGINVWCAAGKGTFGTKELIFRLSSVKLTDIVSHRRLILPQLGAAGVAAPEVARRSGFLIEWGPVRAADIPAWLAAGKVKDAAMREVSFHLRDRMAVAPIEIVHSWPYVLAALTLAALYGLPAGPQWVGRAVPVAIILIGTILVGTVFFPALLPWIPFRAFVVKGALLGVAWAAICAALFHLPLLTGIGIALISAAVTGFLAMNFTGSSTFTSQSGALLEVEKSFWPIIGSLIGGIVLLVVERLIDV